MGIFMMAKNKNKSEKREKKKKLAEEASEAPVTKKKKVSEEFKAEKPPVKPQDPIETEDLTPEELRVLERKLKKERKKEEKRLKREKGNLAEETKAEPAKLTGGERALQFLESWSKKNPDWKFQKIRQTWLLMNMYDLEKVSDKHFRMLLGYLENVKGSARDTTIQKAEEYMKEYDKGETQEEPDLRRMNRIRDVLQLLS
ncbi:protein cholesin isoform X1 [Phyllobates terribilis]|uniref:protein cholesin isoform X1 n=2 Tax=Phyllobates terribilis TaxID=111132 RepID=UPI003CCA822F